MADINKIMDSLHPLERKVLPLISTENSLLKIIQKSGLKEVEVTRALQWLKNKELITIKEDAKELIFLDKNGLQYQKTGLPERKFLRALNREMSIKEIGKISKLSKEEVNVSLGLLKRKSAINISRKGNDVLVSLTDVGRNLLKKDSLEELFLKKQFPVDPKSLSAEEVYALQELMKRHNILKSDVQKVKTVFLTELGMKMGSTAVSKDVIESLTPEIIRNKSWLNKEFRSYDLKTQVPKINYGKKHFENEAIDYIKSIWLNMGFKEMSGTMIQTAFWDLDTLFVPQDHPAREMQDTFYLKNPAKGDLPDDLKKKVKTVHENGGDTGSTGWKAAWDEKKAEQLMLRTHTTVLSAQTISKLKKQDLPMKFFSVGKVFRNEAVDWNHLFEFYQVEGIVVDPDANFENLKGYLEEFFLKMGYSKVMIRPAHFPYTEPSAEVVVFNQEKQQWIELGGAGMFRPEVTKTLMGFECPVLAWGLGLGRVAVPYYNIQDLRDFNRNDIKQLRSMKKWLLQPR
ncbi:TPA: phenylalanine--tRNA ligase subunit alpha [Candidatus Woesearchaeota archaeon]|nr:phenylalanine--tRNA ligase subunit alpha [Candidatus Woesearchaeota archaeon]HIH31950.1 phenylalanine--tRNA ligase subunit alpha [Candidatus Woesearchaeota archaeon]HIH55222.1 phenylalanine--tRNA ligase subunit alpha [Candidatus Woesearchaeota archaeon]HIJ01993.1 phenylalanine--tRNA ligase subunit alpha [Candidatus Woesearchaeota archaeon]